jgi:hypothetical protein
VRDTPSSLAGVRIALGGREEVVLVWRVCEAERGREGRWEGDAGAEERGAGPADRVKEAAAPARVVAGTAELASVRSQRD